VQHHVQYILPIIHLRFQKLLEEHEIIKMFSLVEIGNFFEKYETGA
jgi:hypothetical protein